MSNVDRVTSKRPFVQETGGDRELVASFDRGFDLVEGVERIALT